MTTAPDIESKTIGETRNVAVNFTNKLDSGELLTGTPTVAEVDTSDLTLSNPAVSTTELLINGDTAAIGAAVTFRVVGGTAGATYKIQITVPTDAALAQTVEGFVTLEVT